MLCFLAAATDPVVALLLPISVARAFVLRRWSENTATIGLLTGLIFQLIVAPTSSHSSSYTPGGPVLDFVKTFAVRVGLTPVTGVRITDNIWSNHPLVSWIVGLCVFGLLMGLATWQRVAHVRLFVLLALTETMLLFLVPVFLRDAAPTLAIEPTWFASRWQAAPDLLVLSTAFVATDCYVRRHRRGHLLVLALALVLAPGWTADFRMANPRSNGPAWSHQVALSRQECKTGHVKNVALAISPPGWSVVLPCRVLRNQ